MTSKSTYTALDRTPYTYLIGWSKLDKWYYGRRTAKKCHPSDFWVKYFTSSRHVKTFRELHGEPDVILIRKTFDTIEKCSSWESRVLTRLDAAKSEQWLNKSNADCKFCTAGKKLSADHIKKSADARRGRKHSEEHRMKISQGNMGRKFTEETRAKISAAHQGMKSSKESVSKMIDSKIDKTVYTFWHKKNDLIFTGNRYDFRKLFSLNQGNLHSMVTGKVKTINGWSLVS